MFSLFRSQAKPGGKASHKAFEAMENRIAQIHYYYRHAQLSPEVRQVMAYRKLLELDYFTPQSAQELMRQWHQEERMIGSPS
ncbi:MAG: hypothetical protein NW237_17055 [Cyanobacteriota bacterium]|nr:hypothetical protein [Cyanobacteriota bacterium]